MKKSQTILHKLAQILLGLGFGIILLILCWVFVAGSWGATPAIIQAWGSFLRSFNELPVVGGLSLLSWAVFLAPGFFLALIANRRANCCEESKMNSIKSEKFTVFVDDNFHFMDEGERYSVGNFSTLEEAVAYCRKIVDDYFESVYRNEMTAEQLVDSYATFGEDPFVPESRFSAMDYAKVAAQEFIDKKSQIAMELNRVADAGLSMWKYEVDHKYGALLKEAEIIAHDNVFYFCSGYGEKLIAGWSIVDRIWRTDVARSSLNHCALDSPKSFENAVFGQLDQAEAYSQKQFLIEYVVCGKGEGVSKIVSTSLSAGGLVEFTFDRLVWNQMLIGSKVRLIDRLCKYWPYQTHDEELCKFTLCCEHWRVTFEIEFADGGVEEKAMSLKEFDRYYT